MATSLSLPPPREIPKMDPTKKGWWVEALRSDRFRKGKGFLRAYNEADGLTYHCCLGVLIEVAIEHGLDVEIEPGLGSTGETFFEHEAQLLPTKVMEWAGLDKNGPEVWDSGYDGLVRTELTLVNDDTEAEFPEIADLIDASL